MGRPKKNSVPAEAVAEKNTEVETKSVEQETAKSEEKETGTEVKQPARRPGRPKKAAAAVEEKTVKEDAPKVTRKRASKTVKKAVEKVEEKTPEKAEKKPEEKVVKKVEEVKKTTRAAKAESAVIIQFEGKNIETKNVVEQAKERWLESGNKESALKSIEVYINVTEGMAYPVINGEAQEGFSCR